MEHFELVEKLVNTFGVSYEKAKEALEASNWDAIDAAIYLEREKKGEPQPVPQEIPQEPQQEAPQEPKQEPVQEEPQPNVNRGTKGSCSGAKSTMDDLKREGGKIFTSIWDFLNKNTFVVKKNSGEVFLDIPIWLMALLLCAFFWAVIIILAIVFIMGYRFSFSGPQLGKKKVKNAVDHVESVAEDIVEEVKENITPEESEPAEKVGSILENAEVVIDSAPKPEEPEQAVQPEQTDANSEAENSTPSDNAA